MTKHKDPTIIQITLKAERINFGTGEKVKDQALNHCSLTLIMPDDDPQEAIAIWDKVGKYLEDCYIGR